LSPAPQKRLWQQQIGIVHYFVISELRVNLIIDLEGGIQLVEHDLDTPDKI